MGIIKRGENGKASITDYYNNLKRDNWQGNTRNINAPYYGATGRRKHLHGAALLGGLYLLGQFRSKEPRLFTAAKYAVAPILGTTTVGKIANTAIDVLRASQQLGVVPTEIFNNYADLPVKINPLARIRALVSVPEHNDVRKKYGLQYGDDRSYSKDTDGNGTIGSSTNPDLIPVKFTTQEMTIPLRGTITGLSDTVTPTWNETMYVGRPQGVVTYGGFAREMSFDLTLAAVNPHQLRPMWEKINDISNLVLPQSDNVDDTRFAGRLASLTIGNYIEDQLCAVTGLTITPSEEMYWEIGDPEIHHPSLTLDPSIGKKLQNFVQRKIAQGRRTAALTPLATDRMKKKAPSYIPHTTKQRRRLDKSGHKKFIMPRVVTISFSVKILHNAVPGAGSNTLFRVEEPARKEFGQGLNLPI